jgi:hypothetical protein
MVGLAAAEDARPVSMLKTVMFQVRVTPVDYDRIAACADAEYLSMSTWVRRVVLQAVAEAEAKRGVPEARSDDSEGNEREP